MDLITTYIFSSEIFLIAGILSQLTFNVVFANQIASKYSEVKFEVGIQIMFIISSTFIILSNLLFEGYMFNFLFYLDEGNRYIKLLTLFLSLYILIFLIYSFFIQKLNFYEFFFFFLFVIFSSLLLTSCSDLSSCYLIIELQSLCFYVLATFKRDSLFSAESGLKYFISGALISGFFLLGISLVYLSFGTMSFELLNLLLVFNIENFLNSKIFLIILGGVSFVTMTFLFKIVAFPFHFWFPDIYEGAPLASTIIFSIIPKIAIFSLFTKWIFSLGIIYKFIEFILLFCGIFSVIVGTFSALNQKRLKRLFIFSSISQTGFLLLAISTNNIDGVSSLYFFLFTYVLTLVLIWGHLATFYIFQFLSKDFLNKPISSIYISNLINLFKLNKIWAVSIVIIFFSIGGIPPLLGFLSKGFILYQLISNDKLFFSLILLVMSCISIFYYVRLIKISFFEPNITRKLDLKFQTIFFNYKIDLLGLNLIFFLWLIILFFIYPVNLSLFSQYISIYSNF